MSDDVAEQGDEADEAGASDGASQLIPGVGPTKEEAATASWLASEAPAPMLSPPLLTGAQAGAWLAWWVATWVRPAPLLGLPLDQAAGIPLVVVTLAWAVLAMRFQVPAGRRGLSILIGALGSTVWLPAGILCEVCLAFAVVTGPLFAVPLALVPVILWLAFLGSLKATRVALNVLTFKQGA